MKNKGWTWWCHHAELLEYCTDYAKRKRFIKKHKPANEIPARLKAFQFVKGELPADLTKAGIAYGAARTAYDKILFAFNGQLSRGVWKVYLPQLTELFCKEHPDVAWDKDKQRLIF